MTYILSKRCAEVTKESPLSITITETEAMFEGDLNLYYKSGELEVSERRGNYARGEIIGYKDTEAQELFIYSGIQYIDNNCGLIYPRSFFFGTDLSKDKLQEFLEKIQQYPTPYWDFKNVIEKTDSKQNTLLLSCVESYKRRKKGIHEEIINLPFGSPINNLKEILDQ